MYIETKDAQKSGTGGSPHRKFTSGKVPGDVINLRLVDLIVIVLCEPGVSYQDSGELVHCWADKALAPHPPAVNRIIRSH